MDQRHIAGTMLLVHIDPETRTLCSIEHDDELLGQEFWMWHGMARHGVLCYMQYRKSRGMYALVFTRALVSAMYICM